MSKKIEKIAKLIGTLDNDDLNKIVEVVKHHLTTLPLSKHTKSERLSNLCNMSVVFNFIFFSPFFIIYKYIIHYW